MNRSAPTPPPNSLAAHFHRSHLERRARLFPPRPMVTPRPLAPVAQPSPPPPPKIEPVGEPVIVVTKALKAGGGEDIVQGTRPRVSFIICMVAEHFGMSKTDLISARRTRDVVRPRQIVSYLAKTMTLRSLPEIGRLLGNRDHTTILHGVRKIEDLIGSDQEMRGTVNLLKCQIETTVAMALSPRAECESVKAEPETKGELYGAEGQADERL